VAYIPHDRAGALLEVLQQFATRDINLTRIESRPTREGLGRYCFYLDCEGHIDDLRVAAALKGLHRLCLRVRFLGSYPQAGGISRAEPGNGAKDSDFVAAEEWVVQLRDPGLDGRLTADDVT
jgi:prephenate dehydratase